jgi:pimeloyl-ACP methyl ester carboxylesterase
MDDMNAGILPNCNLVFGQHQEPRCYGVTWRPWPSLKSTAPASNMGKRAAGPNLLLLHSLLTDMTVFDRVLPALAAQFRVTRVNLPGYGQSTPRLLTRVADYADRVSAVLDHLTPPKRTCLAMVSAPLLRWCSRYATAGVSAACCWPMCSRHSPNPHIRNHLILFNFICRHPCVH